MAAIKPRLWQPLVLVTLLALPAWPLQAAPVDPAEAEIELEADEVGAEADSWDTAGESAAKAWDATKAASSDAWKATKESSADAWDATKEFSSDAWDATKEFSIDTWEATRDWVSGSDDSEAPISDPQADGPTEEEAGSSAAAPAGTGI